MSPITDALRADVVSRARRRCKYCLIPLEGQVGWFHIDHIVPRSQGGRTEPGNLALACPRCNGHKWANQTGVDPHTGETVALFNPRVQTWREHFRWPDAKPFEIEGLTPCGRATVSRLRMNDPEMVAIRRLLRGLGIG